MRFGHSQLDQLRATAAPHCAHCESRKSGCPLCSAGCRFASRRWHAFRKRKGIRVGRPASAPGATRRMLGTPKREFRTSRSRVHAASCRFKRDARNVRTGDSAVARDKQKGGSGPTPTRSRLRFHPSDTHTNGDQSRATAPLQLKLLWASPRAFQMSPTSRHLIRHPAI